jgi:hypothetical protein
MLTYNWYEDTLKIVGIDLSNWSYNIRIMNATGLP